MKTTLYFGQPKIRCLNFESVERFNEWVQRRDEARKHSNKHCLSADVGLNGMRTCTEWPHRWRIQLPANKSMTAEVFNQVACDKHIQAYLAKGWVDMGKLCTYCCSNPATVDDTCDSCLDMVTRPAELPTAKVIANVLPESPGPQQPTYVGFCVNRDVVFGCTTYSLQGSLYCAFCTRQGWITRESTEEGSVGHRKTNMPRIRTISSSTRPCRLSTGCAGNMQAAVRRYNEVDKPELWWSCAICRVSQRAQLTQAIPDPSSIITPQVDAIESAESLNVDMTDMARHVRDMLAETD